MFCKSTIIFRYTEKVLSTNNKIKTVGLEDQRCFKNRFVTVKHVTETGKQK